jgi:hypothetical protein
MQVLPCAPLLNPARPAPHAGADASKHVVQSKLSCVENVSVEGLFNFLHGGSVIMLSGAFPLPYRGLRGGSAFELGFIPELQSARGTNQAYTQSGVRRQRPSRVLTYPKTDAGDKCEAVAARTKVGDYIKEIGDGRPLSPTQGVRTTGWGGILTATSATYLPKISFSFCFPYFRRRL